jgi:hypothetical protein
MTTTIISNSTVRQIRQINSTIIQIKDMIIMIRDIMIIKITTSNQITTSNNQQQLKQKRSGVILILYLEELNLKNQFKKQSYSQLKK